MPINRRDFLKAAGIGIGTSLLGVTPVQAEGEDIAHPDARSMLYDAGLCIGCRACQVACKKRSDLSAVYETGDPGLYDMPRELDANTWTLIKLYHGEDGLSFVKNQCMHCIDPACVSVCPVAALQKQENGPVTYDGSRCLGCRYCMAACPFSIPKYQWDTNTPLVRKCDFCADRQAAGEAPACADACPTGALSFGTRKEMIEKARQRLAAKADRYVQQIYGEHEVGGTSMLYISKVPFQDLGFPDLETGSLPEITWGYMKLVPGIILGMGGLMTSIYLFTHRKQKDKEA